MLEFAKDMREFGCVLRRLTAVPHISQKKCFGTFSDSFSPRGEALGKSIHIVSSAEHRQMRNKGFSLEGEAVKNRLFGTDF